MTLVNSADGLNFVFIVDRSHGVVSVSPRVLLLAPMGLPLLVSFLVRLLVVSWVYMTFRIFLCQRFCVCGCCRCCRKCFVSNLYCSLLLPSLFCSSNVFLSVLVVVVVVVVSDRKENTSGEGFKSKVARIIWKFIFVISLLPANWSRKQR